MLFQCMLRRYHAKTLESLSVTTAYVDLGNIAIHPGEHGGYVAVQASF